MDESGYDFTYADIGTIYQEQLTEREQKACRAIAARVTNHEEAIAFFETLGIWPDKKYQLTLRKD